MPDNQPQDDNTDPNDVDTGGYAGGNTPYDPTQVSLNRIIQLLNPSTGGTKFPSRGINLVDVRTPEMQALEQLFMGLAGGMFSNPTATFGGMFQPQSAPGMASFMGPENPAFQMMGQAPQDPGGLLSMLFGGATQGNPGLGGSVQPNPGPNPAYPPWSGGGGSLPGGPSGGGGSVLSGGGGGGGQPTAQGATASSTGSPQAASGAPWATPGTGLAPGTTPDLGSGTLDALNQLIYGGPAGMEQYASDFLTQPVSGRDTGMEGWLSNALTQAFLNPRAVENLGAGAFQSMPQAGGQTDPRFMEMLNQFGSGALGPDVAQQWAGGALSTLPGFSQEMLPGLLQTIVQAFGGEAKAQGGILDPDTPTLVGEQGPELIQGNQITPLGNSGQFSSGNQPGMFQQLLGQNPEMQAFQTGQNLLQDQFFGQNPGQGIMGALEPVFQRNLSFALGDLSNRAPSVSNSAMQLEGTNLAQQALQDFNLMSQQSMLQGQQNQLGGLQQLGSLAGQAGMNPMQRALGAGQLGLQQQGQNQQNQQALLNLAQQQQQFQSQFGLAQNQQQWNQTVGPALQLLLSMLPMIGPTGYQTVAMGG